MNVRTVLPSDARSIDRWMGQWGIPLRDVLPPNGLIVASLAAGWVHLCDSRVALIEPILRNREAADELTDVALDAVIRGLVEIAEVHGCSTILAHTRFAAVVERATQRHGFQAGPSDFTVLTRDLETAAAGAFERGSRAYLNRKPPYGHLAGD